MFFSNRQLAAIAIALLVFVACGLAVIYKTHSGFQLQASRVAVASARLHLAQQGAQRLSRIALDLRGAFALGLQSEPSVERFKASLQWQQDKLGRVLNDLAADAAAQEVPAIEKAQVGVAAMAKAYHAALAQLRPTVALEADGAVLSTEGEAQRRLEELQLALARTLAVESKLLQQNEASFGQIAIVSLLAGAGALGMGLGLCWLTARNVEEARKALQRQQKEAQDASEGLIRQVQSHLSSSQEALQQSLRAAQSLSGHVERALLPERRRAMRCDAEAVALRGPSPLVLAERLIDRVRRAAR